MDTITVHVLFVLSIIINVLAALYVNRLWLKNKELEYEALTDHLTGLWNRRGGLRTFDVSMNATYARQRPKRKHRKVWVLAIDIDHFKKVNDSGGHKAGDEVLVAVANIISAYFRSTDICVRLSGGGDEFLVLMTHSEQELVLSKAEELRKGVEKDSRLRLKDGAQVTISIGIASTEPDDQFGNSVKLLEMVMKRADIALYQAKHAGRNAVVLWDKQEN